MPKDCICDKSICTSCRACEAYCPKNNINAESTLSGFVCVKAKEEDCDCTFSCPQIKSPVFHNSPRFFAVQLNDRQRLIHSTSGGMFSAVAEYVFDHGGAVFGAVYDKNMQVKHAMAEDFEQLAPMHGSKYVQSDISGCYVKVRELLEAGRVVLFSGLPCQIAGLYSFLGKDYPSLITMDLVCSGVPSQKLFDGFIGSLEKQHGTRVVDIKFRDKHKYGLSHTTIIATKDKRGKIKCKTIKDRSRVAYYVAFGKQNCFMDACYNCNYNTTNRISDITVGGFWSIAKTGSQMNERDGVSLAIANTQKAMHVIQYVKRIAAVEEYPIATAIVGNAALVKKTDAAKQDKTLYSDLERLGFQNTANRHFKPSSVARSFARELYLKIKKW